MQIEENPIKRFVELFEQMQKMDVPEPAAVTLATATSDGKPSVRVVLLKSSDESGFVFYTNLDSRKAKELRANPFAALCFYWEPIHYQVRVEGPVELVSEDEADSYFATRPRGSQIGAWASKQSAVLPKEHTVMFRFLKYQEQFLGKEVPRPSFWSGFRLIPQRIEFWQRQENRLHVRQLYNKENDSWVISSLYP
ncbi:pyridoxamine 5'-phosphate oxidase [candidate division KSB1 bacterium]|nr:pyridoxamine 5'-phosphate oxidase [candidate division KSB1 bacterium]TDI95116.1 MAG: pyridoxamine 5'-phosphate oxidase [Caldithrix sp.]